MFFFNSIGQESKLSSTFLNLDVYFKQKNLIISCASNSVKNNYKIKLFERGTGNLLYQTTSKLEKIERLSSFIARHYDYEKKSMSKLNNFDFFLNDSITLAYNFFSIQFRQYTKETLYLHNLGESMKLSFFSIILKRKVKMARKELLKILSKKTSLLHDGYTLSTALSIPKIEKGVPYKGTH